MISAMTTHRLPTVLVVAAMGASVFFQGQPNMWVLSLTIFLLSLWLVHSLWAAYGSRQPILKGPLPWLVIGWWGWAGLSWFWSLSPAMTAIYFWWIAGMPLAYLAFTLRPLSEEQWRGVLAGLRIIGLLLVGYALLLWVRDGDRSFQATFLNHNNLAALLNLLLFPVAAEFLHSETRGQQQLLKGALIFILALGVALTLGRGAGLALLGGVVVLLWTFHKAISRQKMVVLVLLIAAAFLVSHMVHYGVGGVISRFATLAPDSIYHSGVPRYIIWEATWLMGSEYPWLGSGLGTFAQQFPQYQHPEDGMRYFAHNDYLQSWQETGIPGLLLLLSIVGWTALRWFRVVSDKTIPQESRLELSGIAIGLGAVFLHTALTFNLYIPSILIVCGLYLARMEQLAPNLPSTTRFNARNYLRPSIFGLILAAMLILPALFLAKVSLSDWEEQQALNALKAGEWLEADQYYADSTNIWPGYELRLIQRAKIRRLMIHKLRRNASLQLQNSSDYDQFSSFRISGTTLDLEGGDDPILPTPYSPLDQPGHPFLQQQLFDEAIGLLTHPRVERSLLGDGWMERARLYSELPDLVGGDADLLAKEAFEKALARWPNHLPSRERYIRYLMRKGDPVTAWGILKGGWENPHYSSIYRQDTVETLASLADVLQKKFGIGAGGDPEEDATLFLSANGFI